MNRLALHVLAAAVGWLLDHPYAPVMFLLCFAAWTWWLALFAPLEDPREKRRGRRSLFR